MYRSIDFGLTSFIGVKNEDIEMSGSSKKPLQVDEIKLKYDCKCQDIMFYLGLPASPAKQERLTPIGFKRSFHIMVFLFLLF